MTDLDVLPVKMTTQHIIYMEKEYDEEMNLFILSHYSEIRNHFKERNFEFCYFPRMTESELRDFIKDDFIPKGNIPLSSMALKSTLMYDCLLAFDKENAVIPSSSLLFCTHEPDGEPYTESIYRMLSLDMGSQWYLKHDFSNLLDDICYYLAHDSDMPYDSEIETERLYMDPEFLASLPEPDFDNFNQDEEYREMSLDFEEGSLRHHISMLREETEAKVRQMNLLGHDSIYTYSLVRSYNEDSGYPLLIIKKGFSFAIDDVEDEIVINLKDAIHKTVYLLFLRHPDGIRYEEIAQYREEIIRIYKIFKPSYKGSGGGQKTVDNLISCTDGYPKYLVERISRINGIITKEIGNKKIAEGYIIQDVGDGLRRVTIAHWNGLIWQENI